MRSKPMIAGHPGTLRPNADTDRNDETGLRAKLRVAGGRACRERGTEVFDDERRHRRELEQKTDRLGLD